MMVFDGQQRLQSLFIGLKGSYNKKELYINILSGDLKAPEDMKYEFEFKVTVQSRFPFVKFKEIVLTDKRPREIEQEISQSADDLTDEQKDRIEDNVSLDPRSFLHTGKYPLSIG